MSNVWITKQLFTRSHQLASSLKLIMIIYAKIDNLSAENKHRIMKSLTTSLNFSSYWWRMDFDDSIRRLSTTKVQTFNICFSYRKRTNGSDWQ